MSVKTVDVREVAPFGINLGSGAVAVVSAVFVAAMIPATAVWWRFGIVVAVIGVFAALSVDAWALVGVAVIAWLLADGFLENRLGVLSWHGTPDLALVAVLTAAAAVGLVLGLSRRHLRELRSRGRVDTELRALLTHFTMRERHDA